jgi:hypothetical protein
MCVFNLCSIINKITFVLQLIKFPDRHTSTFFYLVLMRNLILYKNNLTYTTSALRNSNIDRV